MHEEKAMVPLVLADSLTLQIGEAAYSGLIFWRSVLGIVRAKFAEQFFVQSYQLVSSLLVDHFVPLVALKPHLTCIKLPTKTTFELSIVVVLETQNRKIVQ